MESIKEVHQDLQEEEEENKDEESTNGEGSKPSLPMGKVKRIVKLDREINKVSSEALLLISLSTDLFLSSLASGARDAALRRKRRTVKLEHVRAAARDHRPTADFLLDCLPNPAPRPPPPPSSAAKEAEKPLPKGTRRIDHIFQKTAAP
ncbi:DNA polymerase II subunit B3-1 [Typha latifolia]|uniref:DNA polymerase II subunit B3-1 n=1 Tax=Typha latifolia TaxID=4733 RepID=UPI003C2CCAA5